MSSRSEFVYLGEDHHRLFLRVLAQLLCTLEELVRLNELLEFPLGWWQELVNRIPVFDPATLTLVWVRCFPDLDIDPTS